MSLKNLAGEMNTGQIRGFVRNPGKARLDAGEGAGIVCYRNKVPGSLMVGCGDKLD